MISLVAIINGISFSAKINNFDSSFRKISELKKYSKEEEGEAEGEAEDFLRRLVSCRPYNLKIFFIN